MTLFPIQIHTAGMDDIPVLNRLIEASVRGLQASDYSPAQIEGALGTALGLDTQLIADGTYFVAESPGESGEMVIVGPEGITRERYAPVQALAQCAFEHVYFSRPDSIVFGRPVAESREQLVRLLARECSADADVVVPVPDSGVVADIGYASESGLP